MSISRRQFLSTLAAAGPHLRALGESGQADNTIVVYTSDHGEMNGDHCLVQKSVFYEQATHIPLMIHVPWLSRGRVRFGGSMSLVGLTPTLLDLLGCQPSDAPFDGESRSGVLADPGSWRNRNVVIEWHDGWRLNLFRGDGPELYDLNTNPDELHNLASQPSQRSRIDDMAAEIEAWQQRHRDRTPLRA